MMNTIIRPIIINIVTTIIALTICKYTLPKNFINNNFKTFLVILALIYLILRSPIDYKVFKYLSSKTKYTSELEKIQCLTAKVMLESMDFKDYVTWFIVCFILTIIRFFIIGYILRYFYPNVENNYNIFSIIFVIANIF